MRKWISVLMAGVLATGFVLAVGSGVAFAQGDDEEDPTTTIEDRFADNPVITAVADTLGLTVEELVEALAAVNPLAIVAEAQGVEMDAIVDAVVAAQAEQLAALVEDGTITQEQADARLALLEANITAALEEGGMGLFGGRGMFGGMMDRFGDGDFFGGMMDRFGDGDFFGGMGGPGGHGGRHGGGLFGQSAPSPDAAE